MIQKDLEDSLKKFEEISAYFKEQGINSITYESTIGLLLYSFNDEAEEYLKNIKDWEENIKKDNLPYEYRYTHKAKDGQIRIHNFRKKRKAD